MESAKTGEPFSYLFKRYWHFVKGRRHLAVLFIVLSAGAHASVLLLPLIFARLLNTVQAEGASVDNFPKLAGIASLVFVVTILFWIQHWPSRVIEQMCAFRVKQAYQNYLLEHIMSLKLAWHGDRDSGDTIDKVEKGSTALFTFAEEIFIPHKYPVS